jgi:hypothetical protein
MYGTYQTYYYQNVDTDPSDLAAYNEELRRHSHALDSQLAIIRNREAAGALSVVQAAGERVRILEEHLAGCRALRMKYSR